MKLHIEGTPEEFAEKSTALTKAFIESIREHQPALADSLEKALPEEGVELRHRVLRELHEQTADEYNKTLQTMVLEIGEVLDR